MILARLERQPGMSQNELAAIAEVAPITVARLVDRLEAQGLVERCIDPKDRRIWRLRLTPAAAPVLRDIKRYRAEVRALMTKGVSPTVLKAMVVGLRKMKENLSSNLAEAGPMRNLPADPEISPAVSLGRVITGDNERLALSLTCRVHRGISSATQFRMR